MLVVWIEFSRSGELSGTAFVCEVCLVGWVGGWGWSGDLVVGMRECQCPYLVAMTGGTDPGRNSRILTACCIEKQRERCRTAP